MVIDMIQLCLIKYRLKNMKTTPLWLCAWVLAIGCDVQVTPEQPGLANSPPKGLEIRLLDVRGSQGNLVLAVYDNQPAFDQNGEPLAWVSVPASTTTITLAEFPAGQIAIAAFHDTNQNGKYDMKGEVPLEGWGHSGDISQWTEPTFEAALTTTGVVPVQLHYHN